MMRFSYVRSIAIVAVAMQLGACSSFLGIKLAHSTPRNKPAAAEAAADPSIAAAPSTEAGRRQLTAGQNGLAIESFRRALTSGEPAGAAVNGLGVAYARIGRYDLAQRFFEEAVAVDPGDARYAENLARLMRSPAVVAKQAALAAASMKAAEVAAAEEASARAAEAAPTPGRLQRVSRGEVRIMTVPAEVRSAANAAAAVDAKFKPLVRISFADTKEPPNRSFVRIQLPEPTPLSKR